MIEMKFVLHSQVLMDVVIDLVNNAEIFPMEKRLQKGSSHVVATSSAELGESASQGLLLCVVLCNGINDLVYLPLQTSQSLC